MKIPSLNGLIMETGEGKWRITQIGKAKQAADSQRIDYHLRFKWIDQSNEANEATPERWMQLTTYEADLRHVDAAKKLKAAVFSWLDWLDHYDARFSYESRFLETFEESEVKQEV
jgi:hypothetical protein